MYTLNFDAELVYLIFNRLSLKTLRLIRSVIDESSLQKIASGLQKNSSITHLDLSRNELGTAGIEIVRDIIASTRTLQKISLEGWELEDAHLGLIRRLTLT